MSERTPVYFYLGRAASKKKQQGISGIGGIVLISEHFTPVSALLGGAILGLAASLAWVLLGKIAGISGILAKSLEGRFGWEQGFVLGLLAAGLLARLFFPELAQAHIEAGYAKLALAGLLVGFGTRLGNGCTSGHGVCGLGRGSPRSLAATAVFMLAGVITVFLWR
jgi:hypothetical protein